MKKLFPWNSFFFFCIFIRIVFDVDLQALKYIDDFLHDSKFSDQIRNQW